MRALLIKVEEAASILIRVLGRRAVVDFLDLGSEEPLRAPGNLQSMLVEVRDRAAAASGSSALVDSKGQTKAGKGRASPKRGISAQTYCALFIAETWKHFRDGYPPPGNKQAQKAAEIYWQLSGGERQSWGNDNLSAWRRHFQNAAKADSVETRKLRAEFQRHLHESARLEAHASEDPSEGGT